MKQGIITAVLLWLITGVSHAQIYPHALGLRLGRGSVSGFEFSYQQGLNAKNRVELDAGIFSNANYNRIGLAGVYHWRWDLKEGIHWYAGPGLGLSLDSYKTGNAGLGLAVGGQIGLDYDLAKYNMPLMLSLDTRPMFDLLGNYSGFGWGVALGVRYTWGK